MFALQTIHLKLVSTDGLEIMKPLRHFVSSIRAYFTFHSVTTGTRNRATLNELHEKRTNKSFCFGSISVSRNEEWYFLLHFTALIFVRSHAIPTLHIQYLFCSAFLSRRLFFFIFFNYSWLCTCTTCSLFSLISTFFIYSMDSTWGNKAEERIRPSSINVFIKIKYHAVLWYFIRIHIVITTQTNI